MITGIDFDLVLNDNKETAEEFRCKICRKLSYDMVLCSKCDGIFCKNCLNTNFQYCLKCGKNTLLCNPNKIIMRILSKIKIKCKNSFCSEVIDYDEFYNHLTICEKSMKKNLSQNYLKSKIKRNTENENGVSSNLNNKIKKYNKPILKENNNISLNLDDNEIKIKDDKSNSFENSQIQILDYSSYNLEDSLKKYPFYDLKSFTQLKSLKLYGNKLDLEKIGELCNSMIYLTLLEVLDLELMMLEDSGLKEICLNIHCLPNLKELNLRFNKITFEGITHFSKKLKNLKSLEVLNLGDNNLSDNGIHELSKNLSQLAKLKILKIDKNNFGNEESITLYLSKSLGLLKNLVTLNLGFNMINSEGFKFISKSLLSLNNLKELLFNHNIMGTRGVKYISQTFSSLQYLEVINLSYNNIDYIGADLIGENFRYLQNLKIFIFEGNPIDKGINSILSNLNMLRNLKSLYIIAQNKD